MRLDDDLLTFLQRPLMCIIAAVDGGGRPSAGRGIGFHVLDDREGIDVIFSGWQWPGIERSVRDTGKLAATFVSPSDYMTFQIKGPAAMRGTKAHDFERASRFIKSATEELAELGVPETVIAPWLTSREARVVRLGASEIYVQTPGPDAGMLAGARLP